MKHSKLTFSAVCGSWMLGLLFLSGCGEKAQEFVTFAEDFRCRAIDFTRANQAVATLTQQTRTFYTENEQLIAAFQRLDAQISQHCPRITREQCSPEHEDSSVRAGRFPLPDHTYLDGPIHSFGFRVVPSTNRSDAFQRRAPHVSLSNAIHFREASACYQDMQAHAERGEILRPSGGLRLSELANRDIVIHVSQERSFGRSPSGLNPEIVSSGNVSCRAHLRYWSERTFLLSNPWSIIEKKRYRVGHADIQANRLRFVTVGTHQQVQTIECQLRRAAADIFVQELEGASGLRVYHFAR